MIPRTLLFLSWELRVPYTCTVSFHICCTKEEKAVWVSLYTVPLRMRTALDAELTSEHLTYSTHHTIQGPCNTLCCGNSKKLSWSQKYVIQLLHYVQHMIIILPCYLYTVSNNVFSSPYINLYLLSLHVSSNKRDLKSRLNRFI